MTERRDFIKKSLVGTAGIAIGGMGFSAKSYGSIIGSNERINLAVIGIRGQGGGHINTYASLKDDRNVRIKTLCDADEQFFKERADNAEKLTGYRPATEWDMRKVFDDKEIHAVSMAIPNHWHALGTIWACQAGKHVFVEKPVAVDGPSARIMYAAGEVAQQKGLKVAAGTQRRHQAGYIETIKQIHDGAIGDIVALRAYWVNGGPIWHRAKEEAEAKTEMEKQIRNWYHYIWLCGDHICEQHVHNIDVCNWIMKDHPVKVWGQGSRQQLGEKSGEIWDNFDCEFEYAAGAHMFSYCGQIKRSWSSVSEAVQGTKGTSNPSGSYALYGQKDSWKSTLQLQSKNPYEQEHIDLINAILNNTELNETKNVTDSTLTAIMGREASYSGALVTWDQILNSEFKYGPDLLYTDACKMTWGAFRTLKPTMPSQHNIFKKPAEVPVA
ncbi:MAG TPA: hypothetical protein DC042_06235 [Bacteroidales bacterium]|nr:hypothetical protein [Bacteroidales bacterium]